MPKVLTFCRFRGTLYDEKDRRTDAAEKSKTLEHWDIYDAYKKPLGYTRARGERLMKGEFHLVSHVCLFDSQERMLIQERQTSKPSFPGKWDLSAGGSVLAGESSREAAVRELYEEMGVRISLDGAIPPITLNYGWGFDDIYVARTNVSLSDLRLQREEVRSARFATLDEILKLAQCGLFVPRPPALLRYLFDLGLGRCAH